MSEMVERVALALAKASGINDWSKAAHEFEDDARAAIEAMREPTEAMVDSCGNGDAAKWGRGCWANYIDAALSTSESTKK